MRVFEDAWGRDDLPRRAVVTVGNYDGVHRGQRAVLSRVTERAARLRAPAVAVSFDPHPRTVLTPGAEVPALTTRSQKVTLLEGCGLDALAVVRFTPAFAETTAEEFVRRFLVGALGARAVLVGEKFSFGRGRQGNLELLRRLGDEQGFDVEEVPKVRHDGEAISSTRIREAVAAGDVAAAREMLGRPYAVEGVVVHGDGRGSSIGWPTANLETANELLPAHGVYAVGVRLEDEPPRPAVANLGVRPTVSTEGRPVAEAHLLDFEGDLYGRPAELLFCRRLRGEHRFPSLEALSEQIGRDAAEAREYFRSSACW
ncbi:MAG: bifunctional riboflavin kinase/FAD synthetase [Thermoanaerobaculia bacterium]|nr:bifunctional riboflavin kinase/FAD synthetase [Thermoanaerobaculia bacterium]